MKKYVVLETSWMDLNTTKNKVSRHFIDCPDPEEVNIDVIHQVTPPIISFKYTVIFKTYITGN